MGAAAGDGVNMFRLVAEGYFLVSWFSPVAILTLFAFTHKNIQYWLFHRVDLFSELLSLGCINLQNLCAHLQEEFLRIPKHPQLAKFCVLEFSDFKLIHYMCRSFVKVHNTFQSTRAALASMCWAYASCCHSGTRRTTLNTGQKL